MSETNDLKAALAENGSFDASRAIDAQRQAVAAFSRRLRKAERLMWVYLNLCVGVGLVAYLRFKSPSTEDMKELIGYTIIILIAFESTVLIKLWYWIVSANTKVMKELKQLRMDRLTGGMPEPRPDDDSGAKLEPYWGLSRWERSAWTLGTVAFVYCIVSFVVPPLHHVWGGGLIDPDLTSDRYVTLAADGSASSVAKMSSRHHGAMPKTSFPLHLGKGADAEASLRWLDDQGRELSAEETEQDDQRRFDVELIEPIMPGERLTYTRLMKTPSAVTQQGDLWTYRADWQFGHAANGFIETVQLPRGAEIESVTPKPDARFTRDGSPHLRFKALRGRNESFRYVIKYRVGEGVE